MAVKKVTAKKKAVPVVKAAGSVERVFKFSSIDLPDAGTDKSPEEVKDFYSTHYPELVNASIKGPKLEGNKEVWNFVPVTGTKG